MPVSTAPATNPCGAMARLPADGLPATNAHDGAADIALLDGPPSTPTPTWWS
ncbi:MULTISPECIES: hypothetical protein [unclassified Streptomyces]|uniref:hypothetical protein n=1 Tax=unclassified Streptomyces TaxID=2593676 RepID=UPI0033220245